MVDENPIDLMVLERGEGKKYPLLQFPLIGPIQKA
jgi:hypothetical protein